MWRPRKNLTLRHSTGQRDPTSESQRSVCPRDLETHTRLAPGRRLTMGNSLEKVGLSFFMPKLSFIFGDNTSTQTLNWIVARFSFPPDKHFFFFYKTLLVLLLDAQQHLSVKRFAHLFFIIFFRLFKPNRLDTPFSSSNLHS